MDSMLRKESYSNRLLDSKLAPMNVHSQLAPMNADSQLAPMNVHSQLAPMKRMIDAGNEGNESIPVSEDETNGSDDLEEDETDDTSGAHVIGDRLAAMRLPTVPEDPRPRGHSDGRHRMDSDGRHRHQDTRYGQEAGYRQDLRRESSEVSDSRSASPQKAPIPRTSSLSSSGANFQGNNFQGNRPQDVVKRGFN